MKKSNIWIRICVHLLLNITVAAYSSEIGNPITDDIKKISLLKQNIPKDYKITVHYLPKDVSGMCWVKLNVFHLEKSLKLLAEKFGNISSNKDNIETFIQILLEMRFHIGHDLENTMLSFQCHYRKVEWPTGQYFEFMEDFFNTANSSREDVECDPPMCPAVMKTTPPAPSVTTQRRSKVSSSEWNSTLKESETLREPESEFGNTNKRVLTESLERGLLALLFIPLIAVGFLLIWKVKSRRGPPPMQRSTDDPPLFIGVEASAPPLDDGMSEKNRLTIGTV